jgi:hypothetical protein
MNKVKMNIDYKYQYTELDQNPLSSINSFNVNTVLQLIENFVNKTFRKVSQEIQINTDINTI